MAVFTGVTDSRNMPIAADHASDCEFLCLVRLIFQLRGDRRELIQGGLQVVGDFLGEHIGFRQVFGIFQAFVSQPKDVEIHFVPLGEFFVIECSPTAVGVLLGPGGFAFAVFLGLKHFTNSSKSARLSGIGFQCEVHVGPQIVNP